MEGVAQSPRSSEYSIRHLGTCRDQVFNGVFTTFVTGLAKALGTTVSKINPNPKCPTAIIARPDILLRGFLKNYVHIFFLRDSNTEWPKAASAFWKRMEATDALPLVVACDPAAYALAVEKVGHGFTCVLSPDDIIHILSSAKPVESLKVAIRSRFPIHRLHPFDHHHPVRDANFVGRRDYLRRLKNNPRTNYAVIGPSKMGKSSLVRRYLSDPEHFQDTSRQIYIDLMGLPASDTELANVLFKKINPAQATCRWQDIEMFLQKSYERFGFLDIVLDEVDEHVHLAAMAMLVNSARHGYCRLILVGRWNLNKFVVFPRDNSFIRMETLRLEQLGENEALQLLTRPLRDLGLNWWSCEVQLENVVQRVGNVPGFIQEFGSYLIEEVEGKSVIEPEAVQKAFKGVINTSRLLGLLEDLAGSPPRIAALSLALNPPKKGDVTETYIKQVLAEYGVSSRISQCQQICDELVIHHLLAYDHGAYKMLRWDFVKDGRRERAFFEEYLAEEIKALK